MLKRKHGYHEQGVRNLFVRRGVVRLQASLVEGDIDVDKAEEIAIECDVEVRSCNSFIIPR